MNDFGANGAGVLTTTGRGMKPLETLLVLGRALARCRDGQTVPNLKNNRDQKGKGHPSVPAKRSNHIMGLSLQNESVLVAYIFLVWCIFGIMRRTVISNISPIF